MNSESDKLQEYVAADLRGDIDDEGLVYLTNHLSDWRSELICMKRKAETQMTSCKSRTFEIHFLHARGKISHDEFLDRISKEKIWKVNASRFLQQIESKLVKMK